jgi:hypothetical protein
LPKLVLVLVRHLIASKKQAIRGLTLFCIVLYQISIFLFYSKSVSGDFAIYLRAAQRISGASNLYDFEENLYIYGPFFAHLLSPFAGLTETMASNIWLGINLFLVWPCAFLFAVSLRKGEKIDAIILFSGIMTLSFPFRNNIGNGSVMMCVLFAFIFCYVSATMNKNNLMFTVLSGLLLQFVFETKPYLGIYLYFFLIFQKKWIPIIYSWILMLLSNVFFYFSGLEGYFHWYRELLLRAKNVHNGEDQATILVNLQNVFPNRPSIYLTVYILVFSFLIFKTMRTLIWRNSSLERFVLILSFATVGSIFAHGQDYVLSVCALSFLLQRVKDENFKANYFIILALLTNWTNDQILLGLLTNFGLILLLFTFNLFSTEESIILFFLSLFPTLLLHFLQIGENNLQFRFYNLFAVIFGLAIWLQTLRHKETNRI